VRCREDALEILLHDASEAYLGDIATPLKAMMPEFRRVEEVNQAAIRAAFGLEGPEPAFVKDLDRRIVLDERRHFVQYDPARPWRIDASGCLPGSCCWQLHRRSDHEIRRFRQDRAPGGLLHARPRARIGRCPAVSGTSGLEHPCHPSSALPETAGNGHTSIGGCEASSE
jgi:hypothetical protein